MQLPEFPFKELQFLSNIKFLILFTREGKKSSFFQLIISAKWMMNQLLSFKLLKDSSLNEKF